MAPKELVMDAALCAEGCFIRRRLSWGGASKRAQQWRGVNCTVRVVNRIDGFGAVWLGNGGVSGNGGEEEQNISIRCIYLFV